MSVIKLFPFDHPASVKHKFPNPPAFHISEYNCLICLGTLVGFKLQPTLFRYPAQPVEEWQYPEFRKPDVEMLKALEIEKKKASESPVPGLLAVAFINGSPVCFIYDTRNISLEQRNMKRASTMGYDFSRKEFLESLNLILKEDSKDSKIVVFE